MKTYYFNIQSKGGAGKSMLTYLQALKYESDEMSLFVDLDSSTKTSVRQLRFVGIKKRVVESDIFDRLRKIEREKLFQVLESVNRTPHERVFVDFGAPESEQLPGLFSIDFSVDEFKAFERELGGAFFGAELHNRNYKGHMRGFLLSRSQWHSLQWERVSRLVLFESALDALSHNELFRIGTLPRHPRPV